MDITTKAGKLIQVKSAHIEVSANPYSEVGWFADVKIQAVMPKGRKVHTLSHSVGYQTISLMPLFGYAQWQAVDLAVYLDFLRSLEVKSNSMFPVALTPELITAARTEVEKVCFCPAVTKDPMSEVA
jgi:hypothetical protein